MTRVHGGLLPGDAVPRTDRPLARILETATDRAGRGTVAPPATSCHAVVDWIQHALLVGAIVGSTAAAAVFALLQAGGLRLSPRVGQTLGRAPAEGDVAVVGGLRLDVSEMERGRITRVGLHLPRTRSSRD